MKKFATRAITALSLSFLSTCALATDFVGEIQNYYIKDNGMVLFSVSNANGATPNCNTSTNEFWPFYFIVDDTASAKMFDMLISAAKNNTTLYVGHDENDISRCKASYLAVIK